MKRVVVFITIIITIFICNYNVNAKDTLYSINKYKEERFDFIESSYNKKGNTDGQVVAGNYLKETKNEKNVDIKEDYQIILVKYNHEGEKNWDFSYGKNSSDSIDYLTYTYNSEGKVDGYLIAMKKSNEVSDDSETSNQDEEIGIFLKIDLDGKLVWEKENKISDYVAINKLIPTYNDNQEFDGYIAVATYKTSDSDVNATIIRYDKEYNVIWEKKNKSAKDTEISYNDLVNIYQDNKIIGYAVIENEVSKENTTSRLLKFTKDGDKEVLREDLEKYQSAYLKETPNGYLLFGSTKEVKLKNGDYSYYLINYDSENKELWETIGDIPISEKGSLKLLTDSKDGKITEYLLLYQNLTDSSIEVIKFDQDGIFTNKIKKISNEYYTITDFQSAKDVLYFIGYLSCPEDDN